MFSYLFSYLFELSSHLHLSLSFFLSFLLIFFSQPRFNRDLDDELIGLPNHQTRYFW